MDTTVKSLDSLSGAESLEAMLPVLLVTYFIALVVAIVCLIAAAKLFSKAGIAGWKVLIPIYNGYLLYKLVFGNGWLFLLNLIPFVGYVLPCVVEFKLAKAFGKGTGFAILSLFFSPITRMILAFGDSEYVGPMR